MIRKWRQVIQAHNFPNKNVAYLYNTQYRQGVILPCLKAGWCAQSIPQPGYYKTFEGEIPQSNVGVHVKKKNPVISAWF